VILLEGHCPTCGNQTLYAEEMRAVNRIICMGDDCPDPHSAHRILQDDQTDHVVHFSGAGFTIRHPLRERIDDALMDCELHLALMGMPGPPEGRPGRFRVFLKDGVWGMERLTTDEEADVS
jgi:hypothetical protein